MCYKLNTVRAPKCGRRKRIQGLPLVDGQMSLPHNVHHRMRKGDHLLLEGPDDTAAIFTLLASDDDDDLILLIFSFFLLIHSGSDVRDMLPTEF